MGFRLPVRIVASVSPWLILAALSAALPAGAADAGAYRPTRYALGAGAGNSYHPDGGAAWFLGTAAVLLDYERIAPHLAPDALAMKFEASAGLATVPQPRGTLSANMLANYTLENCCGGHTVPYVEAGIGLIFTDFRRNGQGLNLNFNPVAGFGVLFRDDSGVDRAYTAIRFHHVSNGGLHKENTGVDSALWTMGVMFR